MQSLNTSWQNFQSFASTSLNNLTINSMQAMTTFGTGMYNFGQAAAYESRVWGTALGMGMNYGANQILPPGTPLYNALNSVMRPAYNTLTQPGYNYGLWMYGEKNLSTFVGACFDSAWAIGGIAGSIGITKAGYNSTFYQYYGPNSNPNSQWLTRVKYSIETANQKLSSPTQWTSMRTVNIPWEKYVGGPRIVAPNFGKPGLGVEYKVGGFGDWSEYLGDWLKTFSR